MYILFISPRRHSLISFYYHYEDKLFITPTGISINITHVIVFSGTIYITRRTLINIIHVIIISGIQYRAFV